MTWSDHFRNCDYEKPSKDVRSIKTRLSLFRSLSFLSLFFDERKKWKAKTNNAEKQTVLLLLLLLCSNSAIDVKKNLVVWSSWNPCTKCGRWMESVSCDSEIIHSNNNSDLSDQAIVNCEMVKTLMVRGHIDARISYSYAFISYVMAGIQNQCKQTNKVD